MNFKELLALVARGEHDYIEIKNSLADARKIGETASAVSNAARIAGARYGWIVWGFSDDDLGFVGTQFDPRTTRVGNAPIEIHLPQSLSPCPELLWFQVEGPDGKIGRVMRIGAAEGQPTAYLGARKIRVGSHNQSLAEYPAIERRLFHVLSENRPELKVLIDRVHRDDLASVLDLAALTPALAATEDGVLRALELAGAIAQEYPGSYEVRAMAMLLCGRDLAPYAALARHAPRVLVYEGTDRGEAKEDRAGHKGFAIAFTRLLAFVMRQVPTREVYDGGLRRDVPVIPELAVREVIANALIHQDFAESGAGPLIEIFADRIVVTNPGRPLAEDPRRLLDLAPQSRNEGLAGLMRKLRIAEERGVGIDRVVASLELEGLPAPVIEATTSSTRVVLLGPREFNSLTTHDKLEAIYYHAAIRWTNDRVAIRNLSVRERFRLDQAEVSSVSRLLRRAVELGLIKTFDEAKTGRHVSYVPYWAE